MRREASLIPEIIERQIRENYKVNTHLKNHHGVATGAGDSMVVAEILQYVSRNRVVALDPYEVVQNPPSWNEGVVIGISVKGKTKEVINALKSLRERRGWTAVSMTAEGDSPLAKSSDYVIRISYKGGELPIGVGNFVSAVAAVAALYGIRTLEVRDVSSIHLPYIDLGRAKEVVLVGSGLGRLLAEFIALKLYEILCKPARTYSSEQFLHAPIYSLGEGTTAIFIGNDLRTRRAYEIVGNSGFNAIHLNTGMSSISDFLNTFRIAVLTLAHVADELMLTKPCFMQRKSILEESTPVIYGE